jgi:hypothetical protein
MARMPREVQVHQTLQKGMMLLLCFLVSLPYEENLCFVFSFGGETIKRRSGELQAEASKVVMTTLSRPKRN